MSRLIEATEDGRLASVDELLSNTGLLLLAGFESTTNLITRRSWANSSRVALSSACHWRRLAWPVRQSDHT